MLQQKGFTLLKILARRPLPFVKNDIHIQGAKQMSKDDCKGPKKSADCKPPAKEAPCKPPAKAAPCKPPAKAPDCKPPAKPAPCKPPAKAAPCKPPAKPTPCKPPANPTPCKAPADPPKPAAAAHKPHSNPPPKCMITNTKKTFGPLNDCDRIFQNLYGRHDWRLKGACQRGDWYRTADLLEMGADWIVEEIKKSGLRGRGGSGFFTGNKCESLSKAKCSNKVVILNCAEGEPGTCKDREILRHEPHKMIEGCLLAGFAMGCDRGIIYVRNRFYNEACNLQYAITEAYRYGLLGCNACDTGIKFDLMVQRGDRYLTGEETALVKCLMGKLGRPRQRPPLLSEKGYFDSPCVVLNTETLAVMPTILRRGAKWFAGLGRSKNAGTKLFNISGNVINPCTVEEEMSIPMRDLIEKHAGGVCGGWDNLLAVFPGGLSTTLIGKAAASDALMDFDCLHKIGSDLGTGGIIVICKDCDPLRVMLRSIEFYESQTCKQCTPCRDGAIWLPQIFENFTKGNAHPHMIDFLEVIKKKMTGTCICALSDSQANVVVGLIDQFAPLIEQRILCNAKDCC